MPYDEGKIFIAHEFLFVFLSQVLEEVGIWKQIKRLAGTSAGAMTAALLAVGYNSRDLEKFLSQDLNKIFVG